MTAVSGPPRIWIAWLQAACAGVVVYGALLVAAPALTRRAFSLLLYSSASTVDSFGVEPVRYVSLAHAVIGAVLIGWGACLLLVTRRMLARGDRFAWNLLAGSVCAWFVPDTAYSLLSGYWRHAILNLAFFALLAIPLLGVRRHLSGDA